MADNWLTDGDCETCRRKKYCKTKCRKHLEREKREVSEMMLSVAGGMMETWLKKHQD